MPKQVPWTRIWSQINNLEALEGFAERMQAPAELATEVLMNHITGRQPLGHDEVQAGGMGKVSDRVGHKPIEKGWQTSVNMLANALNVRVENTSQHFKYVMEGTKRHPIPGKPKLWFWWGDPHPWPAPEELGGTGLYSFFEVDHPGQQPNPFVRDAKDAAMPEMSRLIFLGTEQWIAGLFYELGLRRVK